MEASNVVRMRVKPEFQAEFHEFINRGHPGLPGMLDAWLIKTGDHDYCYVGRWVSMEALAEGRPAMAAELDQMRHMLADLGSGVTDAVSGDIVSHKSSPRVPFHDDPPSMGVAAELGR